MSAAQLEEATKLSASSRAGSSLSLTSKGERLPKDLQPSPALSLHTIHSHHNSPLLSLSSPMPSHSQAHRVFMAVLAVSITTAVSAAASGAVEKASLTSTSHREAHRTTSTPSPGSISRRSAGPPKSASGFTCSRKSSPCLPQEAIVGHPPDGFHSNRSAHLALSSTPQYARESHFGFRPPSHWQKWTCIVRPPSVVRFLPPALPWPRRVPEQQGWDSLRHPLVAPPWVCTPPSLPSPPPLLLHCIGQVRERV